MKRKNHYDSICKKIQSRYGISQGILSRMSRVNNTTISKKRNGHRAVKISDLYDLAETFGGKIEIDIVFPKQTTGIDTDGS